VFDVMDNLEVDYASDSSSIDVKELQERDTG
jgi:hypothetical protein